MLVNAQAVVEILAEKILGFNLTSQNRTADDNIFAKTLFDIIHRQATGQGEFQEELYLDDDDYGDSDDEIEETEPDDDTQGESSQSEFEPSPQKKKAFRWKMNTHWNR